MHQSITMVQNTKSDDCFINKDIRFGIGRYRPKCLQGFARIHWFVAFLSMFSVMQGMLVNGLMSACIPHLEREFGLSSTKSGMILASNDISGLLLVLIISYFGESSDKPKWLGCGSIITGLGMLLFSLPKFIKGPYIPSTSAVHLDDFEMCRLNASIIANPNMICNDESTSSEMYLAIFFIANMMAGAGTAPLFTLGATYLDENVSPKKSPLFLGIWYAAILFGPSTGYFIAGNFLSKWVDIDKPAIVSISSTQWVGRWWLPYLTLSWILILVGFFLAMFPKKMPNAESIRKKAIEKGEIKATLEELGDVHKLGFVGFIKATLSLIKNKFLLVVIFGSTAKLFIATGIGPFYSKLLVVKFNADPIKANAILGVTLLVCSATGLTIGSVMMNRMKVTKSVRLATWICIVLGVLSTSFGFVFKVHGCDTINLAGTNYNSAVWNDSSYETCNFQCGCLDIYYQPVCKSGVTFLSPCAAGCNNKASNLTYSNCSCVRQLDKNESDMKHVVHSGKCDQGCQNLKLFVGLTAMVVLISFVGGTPQNMIIIRSVPENQRSFAMGLNYLILRAFGMLPGPIVIGNLLDKTCLIWKYDICGRRLNCAEYKILDFSNNLLIVALTGNGISLTFFVLALFLNMRDKKLSSQKVNKPCNGNENKHAQNEEDTTHL